MSNIMHLLFELQKDNVKAKKMVEEIKEIIDNEELFPVEKIVGIEDIIEHS